MNELDSNIHDRIESFIISLDLPFEQVKPGLWIINDELDFIENIVVYHNPPVLTFRIKLVENPEEKVQPELYRRLLELNATSMVAGAYGLEDNSVVLVDAIQSENLDENEFQASIDGITLAAREHYDELRQIIAGRGSVAAEEAAEAADQT